MSISRNELTVANLVCLTRTIREDPALKDGLGLYVVDAEWAAAQFDAAE